MDQMQISYVRLIDRVYQPAAVAAAVDNLRRHSCRNVVCSLCWNDDVNRFKVTGVDSGTGSVTEVKCERCKETSYVCHFRCYFQRTTPNGLEYSYKGQCFRTVQRYRKSIRMCSVVDSTVTLLRRNNKLNGYAVCSCGNNDVCQLKVTGVDRLGFITSLQCCVCQSLELNISPLEESYVVQMLYHGQPNQDDVMQRALNGDYVERLDELCSLLRRHSFYDNSICPEIDTSSMPNEKESCRVIATTSDSVTEVEFDVVNESSHEVQRLVITCGYDCYYRLYNLPSEYERTYKAEMRAHLQAGARQMERREVTNGIRLKEAMLSCSVLTAGATILRRHSIENKLCGKCKNDDYNLLKVTEIDKHGFIRRVQCSACGQSMSTACHRSHFYYEEIDDQMTLERGDHIAWHRNLAYWHHAVVTNTDDTTVTLAHYQSGGCFSVIFQESTKSRQDMSASCLGGIPYRITYDDCYTNEYSALRSETRVGERRYNAVNRNCEHSSNWCKTGLSQSDQMKTCFSSVGKTMLAFCLRILNMLLLVVFQVIHEKREGIQIDRKAFEFFEHVFSSAYMLLVFLLFLVWSMYTECNKLKPTSDKNYCCSRPAGVACGVSTRIIVRELFAAVGLFLLIWFEDRMVPQEAVWKKSTNDKSDITDCHSRQLCAWCSHRNIIGVRDQALSTCKLFFPKRTDQ